MHCAEQRGNLQSEHLVFELKHPEVETNFNIDTNLDAHTETRLQFPVLDNSLNKPEHYHR